jgi:hypothetical protein
MTNEDILKEILRGEAQLSPDVMREASKVGPALVALVRNIRLWHTEDAGRWAVLHAIRLLSDLHVKDAVPALVDAIFLAVSTRHEEAMDDLPVALARSGPEAIPALSSVVEDRNLEGTIRSLAASALEGIAVLHPDQKQQILTTFRQIAAAAGESAALRGHVITLLAHFRMDEDAPLIKAAVRGMPMMLDLEAEDIDEYFNEQRDPESWIAYRTSLLEYYK